MKLHAFPSDATRAAVHNLVHLNAIGKLSRVRMDGIIEQVLTNYGLTHIHLDGYTMRLGEPITTALGWFPVTSIEAKFVSTGANCPRCGGKGGYLEGDSVITMACRGCGTVFRFKEVDINAAPTGAGRS